MKTRNQSDLLFKFRRAQTLPSIQISLTNRCNERCRHCLAYKQSAGELSTEQLKGVLKQLKELNGFQVGFTGGEAMLRKDFFELLSYSSKCGLATKVYSNGMLINEEAIKHFKKSLVRVQVSVYGTTAKTHDYITGVPGSFVKTMRALELLHQEKIPFNTATIIMCHNYREAILFYHIAKHRGWDARFDPVIVPQLDGKFNPLKCRLSNKQLEIVIKAGLISNFLCKPRKAQNKKSIGACLQNIGKNHLYISSIGEAYTSVLIPIKVGDLKQEKLVDIWRKSQELHRLRNLEPDQFECHKCAHSSVCPWHPGLALTEHHDFYKAPEEICRIVSGINSLKKSKDMKCQCPLP